MKIIIDELIFDQKGEVFSIIKIAFYTLICLVLIAAIVIPIIFNDVDFSSILKGLGKKLLNI